MDHGRKDIPLQSFIFKKSEIKKEDPPKKKWEDRKPYKKDYQSRRTRTSRSRSPSYDERDRDRHRHSRRGRNDGHDNNRRLFF